MVKDSDLLDLFEQALKLTLTQVHARSNKDIVARAQLFLLARISNSWRSIETLRRVLALDSPETFMVDAGTIMRAMYEAYVQAAYIAHDPISRIMRASLYLNYVDVERYKVTQTICRHHTSIGDRIKSTIREARAGSVLDARFTKAKDQYRTKKGNIRDKWYDKSLGDLARIIEDEDAYDFFVTAFHGYVHSSAFALMYGPPILPEHVTSITSHISAKAALISLQCMDSRLSEPHQSLLEAHARAFNNIRKST